MNGPKVFTSTTLFGATSGISSPLADPTGIQSPIMDPSRMIITDPDNKNADYEVLNQDTFIADSGTADFSEHIFSRLSLVPRLLTADDVGKTVLSILSAEKKRSGAAQSQPTVSIQNAGHGPARRSAFVKAEGAGNNGLMTEVSANGTTSAIRNFLFRVEAGRAISIDIGHGITLTYNPDDIEYDTDEKPVHARIVFEIVDIESLEPSEASNRLMWLRRTSAVSSTFIRLYGEHKKRVTGLGFTFPELSILLPGDRLRVEDEQEVKPASFLEMVDGEAVAAIKSAYLQAGLAYAMLSKMNHIDLATYDRIVGPVLLAYNHAHTFLTELSGFLRVRDLPDEELAHVIRGRGHNFNNRMTVITGYSSLIRHNISKGKMPSQEKLKAFLLRPKNIGEALSKTYKLYLSFAEGLGVEIDVENNLPDGLKNMDVNEDSMERVEKIIENLLSNGIKYHNKDLKRGERTVRIVVSQETSGDIVIYVIDNGRGMDAEELEHYLGTEQWRSPSVMGNGISGDGIGHGSVIRLVRRLGGGFKITSQPKMGTTAETRIKKDVLFKRIPLS